MEPVLVLTGIARYSFGASFIRALLRENTKTPIIGIDRIPNPDFAHEARLTTIVCDLNPLTFEDGYPKFAATLADKLSAAVRTLGDTPIKCLIQFAGTYEFGPFVGHELIRRQRVLGLNLLGITEVLYSVMALNAERDHDNTKVLTHVLIGSLQALDTRAERSIYAASKAYGLDLCAGLSRGHELANCIYLALGPMDTAMLHWNHWTAKVGGSNRFFQYIFAGDPDRYKSIFMDCNESALVAAAESAFPDDLQTLVLKFKEYRRAREQAFNSEVGVLNPNASAQLLTSLLAKGLDSGLYSLNCQKGRMSMKMATFEQMSRKDLFFSVAREVAL